MEKENSEKMNAVLAAFKRALEGFGGCFERLLCEVSLLNGRVDGLKEENRSLAKRLADVELRAGIIPKNSPLDALPQMEPPSEAPT
jgi:hypothetical protein